jgi:hypothetical protein
LQAFSSAQETPFGLKRSPGQLVELPEHVSVSSQALTAALHTVPALPAGWTQAPLPSHSSAVQTSPSSAHATPDSANASVGQDVSAPEHFSSTSQAPVAGRHVAPALPGSCAHAPEPLQASAVQGSPSDVHAVPFGWKPSVGQIDELPVQVSATSHSPAATRHASPSLPAGWLHVAELPVQTSSVQGFKSSAHATPAFLKSFAGQLAPEPSQVSATSHSPAELRHEVPERNSSAGQVALKPVQDSTESQMPAETRQTAPWYPGGC